MSEVIIILLTLPNLEIGNRFQLHFRSIGDVLPLKIKRYPFFLHKTISNSLLLSPNIIPLCVRFNISCNSAELKNSNKNFAVNFQTEMDRDA